MPPAVETLRRLRRQHHGRHRFARRARRVHRQGAPDELGDVFRHDIRAIGVRFDVDSGAPDGLPHRPLPDLRHARRAAHDADVSSARAWSCSRRCRRRSRRERAGHVPRGLSLGSARREAGVPQGGDDRAWRRAQGRALAFGSVLRRALPRRVRRPRRTATSISSSRTSTRSSRCTRSTSFDDALQRVRGVVRDRRAHAQREGLRRRGRRRGARDRCGAGRARRRYDRRRRPVRRRVPVRPDARRSIRAVRAHRSRSPRPR